MACLETAIGPLASARGPIAIALREKSRMKGLLGDLHKWGSAMRRIDRGMKLGGKHFQTFI